MKYSKKLFYNFMFIVCFSAYLGNIYGQGIGNNLAFQGEFDQSEQSSVKAIALGNAYTAVTGDVNSIFYNPAGLADINGIQISASVKNKTQKQYENQHFVPVGGSYGIMELIWAGIYTPQLEDDGIRSDYIKYDLENDFLKPDSAEDFFDEKFADWVDENKSSGLNNFLLAVPFNFQNRKFVVSAAYTNSNIYNFDRNEHVLGTDYGYGRIIADSNWYVYNRSRIGDKSTFVAALSSELNDNIDVGLSFEYMSGETNDNLSREVFAHMQIQQEQNINRFLPTNTYFFWHDSTTSGIEGKTNISSFKVSLGAIYKSDKITFGLRVNSPYTITNSYDYREYEIKKFLRDTTAAPIKTNGKSLKGTNKFKAPFTFDIGFTLRPTSIIMLSMDYKIKPFSNAGYDLSLDYPNFNKWALPDMNSFHAGIEIIPIKYISLLAGYSLRKNDIRAEDHYKGERIGTKLETFSAGLSIKVFNINVDFAYELRNNNYIDYYSYHTDYISNRTERLLAGVTVVLK